jgi:hypothetical protein
LSDREAKGAPVAFAGFLAPDRHFAEHVRHAGRSIPATHVHHPLREDRSIRHAVAPKRFSDTGVFGGHATKVSVRYAKDRRCC